MADSPTKERFFELLHRASQPQRSTSSKTKASRNVGGSSGRSKPVGLTDALNNGNVTAHRRIPRGEV